MNRLQELTDRVLDMLLAGDEPVLALLREQRKAIQSCSISQTGRGFFANFSLYKETTIPTVPANFEITDVEGDSDSLQYGVGFLLFVRDGYLAFLEAHTYGEDFDRACNVRELYYIPKGQARDIEALHECCQSRRPDSQD